jgi:hypothetical protein
MSNRKGLHGLHARFSARPIRETRVQASHVIFLATYDLSTGSQEVKLRKGAESTKNPQEKPRTGERELRPDSSFFLGGSWNPSFFFNSKLKMLWSQITNPPCRLGFLIWVKGFIHAG